MDEEAGEPAQPKMKPINDATRQALADVLENGSLSYAQISAMLAGNDEEEMDETEQEAGKLQGPPTRSGMVIIAGRK